MDKIKLISTITVDEALNGEIGNMLAEGDNGLTMQLTTGFPGQPMPEHLNENLDGLLEHEDEIRENFDCASAKKRRVYLIALKILLGELHYNFDENKI